MHTSLLPKLAEILHQNINDPNFGIPEFCEALNISRSHLHRKVTEQTGLSTSHYIRRLRLEKAKKLLEMTDSLVYEVAHQVGFSNVAYFSTCFLAAYNCTPKSVQNNQKLV